MLALFPEIARSEADRERLGAAVGAALGVLEALSLPAVALLATFSSEIVVLLGGHSYDASGPVLAILALALGVSYINGVYGNALLALGRQNMLFWLTLPTLVVNLVANLLLIPPYGADGAAWAVVISEVVGLAIIRGAYVRVAGRPPSPPHLRILIAGTALGALAAIKFGLSPKIGDLALVLGGGALGLVVYAALILLLGALPESILVRLPQFKPAR
jgi:O-antigen/teichoic acid export membrane protein